MFYFFHKSIFYLIYICFLDYKSTAATTGSTLEELCLTLQARDLVPFLSHLTQLLSYSFPDRYLLKAVPGSGLRALCFMFLWLS